MIGKILKGTQGKPCSCPSGKICTACKPKKGARIKPRVKLEGSSKLPVPITITTYKDKTRPTTVERTLLHKPRSWSPYQTEVYDSEEGGTKLCRWYKQRKALNQLRKINRLEQERLANLRQEKLRRERELEFLELLNLRQKEINTAEQKLEAVTKKKLLREEQIRYSDNYDRTYQEGSGFNHYKKNKPKTIKKARATTAKPIYGERSVSAKTKISRMDSLNDRFANFCYRICCQFYCCITIILMLGFLIIFIM